MLYKNKIKLIQLYLFLFSVINVANAQKTFAYKFVGSFQDMKSSQKENEMIQHKLAKNIFYKTKIFNITFNKVKTKILYSIYNIKKDKIVYVDSIILPDSMLLQLNKYPNIIINNTKQNQNIIQMLIGWQYILFFELKKNKIELTNIKNITKREPFKPSVFAVITNNSLLTLAKKETVEDKIKFIEGKYVCRQKKLIGLKEFSKNRTKDIFELKPMFNLEKSPMFKNYFIDNNHFYYFNVVSYEMYKYDYFKRDLLIIKLADSINYLKSNYDSVYNHKFVSQSLLKTPLNERIITVFDLGDNILIMRTKAKDFFSKKYKFDIINKKSHHVDSIFELDSYDYNYKTDTMHKILKSFKELPFMFTHTYTEFGERYFIVTRAFNKLNSKIGMRQKEIIDDNSTCFHTKNYTIKYYIFKYIIE